MASKHTSSETFNFQFYFDLVKQKQIAWYGFVKSMEDFCLIQCEPTKRP